MHVIPWGQKKPSQQGRQFVVLIGTTLESLRLTFWPSEALQDHPGSHPDTHDVRLQFLLGLR